MWKANPEGRIAFVAIEGCDGAGKSTIRDILAAAFQERSVPTTVIGQHSWLDPWTARLIVEIREQRRSHPPSAISDAYFRDKYLHARLNVLPACADSLVISDRYVLSDAVYLEAIYGIPAEHTLERHRVAGTPMPAALVYVTLDVDEAVRRISRRGRHTQHYERPADLRRIVRVYERVLSNMPLPWLPRTIVFDNTAQHPEARIRAELLPHLCTHIGFALPQTS